MRLDAASGSDGGLRWGSEDWTLRATAKTFFSAIAVLAYPPPATPAQPEAPPLLRNDPVRVGEKPPRMALGTLSASVAAGATESGFADGPPADARFGAIVALDGDGAGNLYVADAGNHRIRRVDRRGLVTTLAGTGEPVERDGPAPSAAFRELRGLGVDALGNCYVLDGEDLRLVIARGVVSTLGPIRIPTGEQSYTNYVGWGPDTTLVECEADEFYQARELSVSAAGVVHVLGSATKRVRSVLLRFGTTTYTSTTNSALLHRTTGGWITDIESERSLWTCGGCTPPGGGEPPPISVNGTLIAAVSRGVAGAALFYGEEYRGTPERFGRISVLDAGGERPFATHLVGLPEITALGALGSDAVLLLGRAFSGGRFYAVGRESQAFEVPAGRAPDIGLVVDRHGIVYSATPTEILRFVPEGVVVLEWAARVPGEPVWWLGVIAPVGATIRIEQSADLDRWNEWRTFTSTGRNEWELPADAGLRFFRAVLEAGGGAGLLPHLQNSTPHPGRTCWRSKATSAPCRAVRGSGILGSGASLKRGSWP